MQLVQGSGVHASMNILSGKKMLLKWGVLLIIGICNGYASILMFSRGELAFAMLTIVLTALAIYIFGSRKTYAHRYIYPGIAGMILFILFPLLYTVGLSFTNYSAKNQLSLERAQSVLLAQTFRSGKNFPFTLYQGEEGYRIIINAGGKQLTTAPFDFHKLSRERMSLSVSDASLAGLKKVKLKTVIQHRKQLGQTTLQMPDGALVRMNGLRKFAAISPLYSRIDKGQTLHNHQTGQDLKPNMSTGFYQPVDEAGAFTGQPVSPGFIVRTGTANFQRVWQDEGIKEPFVSIFIWTVVFSVATVVLTLAIGLILASLVQWEALKGRAVYRVLLILPYAVPAFISILIFKGLFNQSFGEINLVLKALFGLSPAWFSDPFLARSMVIIVNTWLGFPYMMILCMGLLKAIPDDLYEASAIDGAGPFYNFMKITVPLMIKPLTPLLIASFAFNFNNFVMIYLLTSGGPNMIGTSEPAGYTDLLVSYTYRIAFEGSGGRDFGLASAIATLIFLLVGALALFNLRFTRLEQD
ncbi:Maltose transport system permease protein MalF [Vibrio aerogenes CECT 7868]|uniref:Maltose/maltodextrin transport system permease protein n=1 Tax=Vibrio aerogenes CECT 7868 TaxID=1216006 RepID=A0A1M5UYS9_9VIBR|nr:maltose ABC transporter permease MalF [Vibrio aerogenes]SHH68086.1 Maltose transport system permease protein MalF [Vibrio aerogenes CECT 7868]